MSAAVLIEAVEVEGFGEGGVRDLRYRYDGANVGRIARQLDPAAPAPRPWPASRRGPGGSHW